MGETMIEADLPSSTGSANPSPTFKEVVDEFCIGQVELRARLARSSGVRHGNEVSGSGTKGGHHDGQG